jgi:hypothetical protein
MTAYQCGNPKNPGESNGVNIEISSREVRQWLEHDASKVREIERFALIEGLKQEKRQYLIKGAGDSFLDHGSLQVLQRKYPDVSKKSTA